MFASLKRTFQKDRSSGQERITAASRIQAIVRQLRNERELLSVRVPGCEQAANTAILDCREKQGVFFLDELNIDAVHQALVQQRRLRVDCRLQGTELRFAAALRNVEDDGGLALYEMALPRVILRTQRREHYRLRLGTGLVVPISIPSLEGETVKGEVFDLSSSGMGAYLHTRNLPAPGKILTGVTLSLPRTRAVKTAIEIRFARQNTTQHMLRIGARFVDLDRTQERKIARFLAEQQRKRRRHRPG